MEILREAPKPSSLVPLLEHQSSTPASFYTGPPVLHYYSDRSKLVVLEHEAQSIPALAPLLQHATSNAPSESNGTDSSNGDSPSRTQKIIADLDVYVTSDKLFLFSTILNTGLSIPYPSISLHAIQSLPSPTPGEQQGLYMQVLQALDQGSLEDEEPESISLTVIPTASAPPQQATTRGGTTEMDVEGEEEKEQTPVLAMFNALSACSNLHPDPVEDGDDDEENGGQSRLFSAGLAFPGARDGGLPPAMPGSGGWITAENMHEFVDEEGNWIGGDDEEAGGVTAEEGTGLGPGAGTVRARVGEGGNGDTADAEEDETKWRRTG